FTAERRSEAIWNTKLREFLITAFLGFLPFDALQVWILDLNPLYNKLLNEFPSKTIDFKQKTLMSDTSKGSYEQPVVSCLKSKFQGVQP
ncbi:hypothetical protein, partial [Thermococcus sp.]|uniref:hypothetical protein n=1 Tax=Thermococcus sp. TaxID=35749 RepID=UPI002639FB77